MKRLARAILLVVAASPGSPAYAQDAAPWPDTFLSRVEALALIQTLNAEILGSRTATASLEHWCRDHQLAANPRIVARTIAGVVKAPAADQLQRLEISRPDEVKYRRVQLRCGARVLSEADNWYVPGRLTPDMNRLLETGDTPFGRVVASLEPYRRTFAVTLLWTPLPDAWERLPANRPVETGKTLAIPDGVFEHRAVLYTREHRPFAEVDEVYQRQVLGAPPAQR